MKENNTKFIKIGNKIIFKSITDGLDYNLEKGSVYTVDIDRYSDEISFSIAPDLALPKKIYSTKEDESFINRVLSHYNNTDNGVTGIMLAGLKGSGKTVMSKNIATKSNLPIIIIDKAFNPQMFKNLFNKLKEIDACIVFDEVDKLGENYDSDYLLQVLDGMSTSGKKLVIFTCNDDSNINEYLLDRCSRIRYWKEFGEMSNSMVRLILEDKLNDKSEVDTLTDFIINKFGCVSFDNVCSFALEVNENPKDTYELLFEDMNLSQK